MKAIAKDCGCNVVPNIDKNKQKQRKSMKNNPLKAIMFCLSEKNTL